MKQEKLMKEILKERKELKTKIKQIKKEISQNKASLRRCNRRKRDIINAIKIKNNEANRQKELRDQINLKIKKLKKEREKANNTVKELVAEYKKRREGAPKVDFKKMEKELKALEWKLQTSVLEIKKEDALVERIEKLRKELSKYQDLLDLSKKIDKHRKISKKIHEKILHLSEESQKHHEKFLHAVERIKELENRIDEINKEIAEITPKIERKIEELDASKNRLKEIDKELEKLELEAEVDFEVSEEELKERAELIYERFKNGEKLNLDDIYLLRRFNLV
jgi:phosphoserine phosphatase